MRNKLNIGLVCLGILSGCATYEKVYEVVEFQGTVIKKERVRISPWPAPKEHRIVVVPNKNTNYCSQNDTIKYDGTQTYRQVETGSQVGVVKIKTHRIKFLNESEIPRDLLQTQYDINPKEKTEQIVIKTFDEQKLKKTTGIVVSKLATTDYSKYEENDDYTIKIAMNLEGKIDTINYVSKSLHNQVEKNSIVDISYFEIYKNGQESKYKELIDTKIYNITYTGHKIKE